MLLHSIKPYLIIVSTSFFQFYSLTLLFLLPDDQTQPFEMTPGFKPFTVLLFLLKLRIFAK